MFKKRKERKLAEEREQREFEMWLADLSETLNTGKFTIKELYLQKQEALKRYKNDILKLHWCNDLYSSHIEELVIKQMTDREILEMLSKGHRIENIAWYRLSEILKEEKENE
jgi:hypothetical protein